MQGAGWDDVLPRGKRRRETNAGHEPQSAQDHVTEVVGAVAALLGEEDRKMLLDAHELFEDFMAVEPYFGEPSSGSEEEFGEVVAESDAGVDDEPVTPANCLRTLRHVRTIAEVNERLPAFHCSDPGWRTKVRATGEVLGVVRCIGGSSMRADCRKHKLPGGKACKVHCNILGRWDALDSELAKWLVAGSVMSADEHQSAAQSLKERWARDD